MSRQINVQCNILFCKISNVRITNLLKFTCRIQVICLLQIMKKSIFEEPLHMCQLTILELDTLVVSSRDHSLIAIVGNVWQS